MTSVCASAFAQHHILIYGSASVASSCTAEQQTERHQCIKPVQPQYHRDVLMWVKKIGTFMWNLPLAIDRRAPVPSPPVSVKFRNPGFQYTYQIMEKKSANNIKSWGTVGPAYCRHPASSCMSYHVMSTKITRYQGQTQTTKNYKAFEMEPRREGCDKEAL